MLRDILWSAGSVALRRPPRQPAEEPAPAPGQREGYAAGLPNSPARRREGDTAASHPPQVRPAAMALAQAQTQEVGTLPRPQPIVEEEGRAHERSPARRRSLVPPAAFQVRDRRERAAERAEAS